MSGILPREVLIVTIARLLDGVRHVAVGASSPIPAAGAMLLRAMKARAGAPEPRLSILGSVEHNFFTNGSAELFDCAGQGRIDAFFLGGGQIDGHGNVNLVGAGGYPR
jgi:glutaconate CoA-transferase subunit B